MVGRDRKISQEIFDLIAVPELLWSCIGYRKKIFERYFRNSYVGLLLNAQIGLVGLFSLCVLMVPCMIGITSLLQRNILLSTNGSSLIIQRKLFFIHFVLQSFDRVFLYW